MQIYLLRHGIAEDATAGKPDSGRALTAEGREKLRRVLKRVRAAEVSPGAILSSPYRRALESAAIAAQVLGFSGEVEQTRALLPEASPHDAWEEVRTRKNEKSILVAGHEPFMSSMLAFLLDCPALQVDMKKGAIARVDCERLGPPPKGVLKWMITPGLAAEP